MAKTLYEALKRRQAEVEAEFAKRPRKPETLEQMAERGKREALRVALENLAEARTPSEKTGAVGAMSIALKLTGLDGAQHERAESVEVNIIEAAIDDDADEPVEPAEAKPRHQTQ